MVPHRAKAGPFRRSSILFRPQWPAKTGELVESPGTAPGSEPFIMGAFIAIVRVAPDMSNIGPQIGLRKGGRRGGERKAAVRSKHQGFAQGLRGVWGACAKGEDVKCALCQLTRLCGTWSRNMKNPPQARGLGRVFISLKPSTDQKPDLIISNSLSIRSRIWVGIGVCASSVVSIGFTSAATNCSIGISFMAALLAEA